MKKLLIIYPHWIPSNLVGVQRARLIANFLTELGWQPIILAVHPKHYEEPLVQELEKTVSDDVQVYWCEAKKVRSSKRLIGDIALRAYKQLIAKGIEIAQSEKVDFIWSPLPSFYTALIVRRVHDATNVPYGLDYMDPWVHNFPGAKFPNKAWLAKRVAMILEPIAVKKASLLTGVSELSYLPVIERNPHLRNVVCGAMPLGFDSSDYNALPENKKLLWSDESNDIRPLIYAGAFLPQAHYYVNALFKVIAKLRECNEWDNRIKLYFVGTGNSPLKHITDYASDYGLSDIVYENTERISYLEVLNNLSSSFGILVIGNIEKHYTASKIFQTLLSGKKILPIFHKDSTVVEVLKETNANEYLVTYFQEMDDDVFLSLLTEQVKRFILSNKPWNPNLSTLDKYSAKASATYLVELIEKAIVK
ncbi:MAG: hypothetical protein R3Y59_06620 [bacterium]